MLKLRSALISLLLLTLSGLAACQSSDTGFKGTFLPPSQADTQTATLQLNSGNDLSRPQPVLDAPLMVASEDEDEEPCLTAHSATRPFLPIAAEPPLSRITPATENECGFYNWALQAYLHTTQPDAQGRPAFLDYEPVESVFDIPLYGGEKPDLDPQKPPLLNAGFQQAGDLKGILVDSQRNPIFYSIYINAHFSQFVRQQGLNQVDALLKSPHEGGISAELEFPPGAIELKAAWGIVDPGSDPGSYFTMQARVPLLRMVGNRVVASAQTREVTVALLGLHVVGVVEDHPEFIWATFEHVNAREERDLAPSARQNPDEGPLTLDDFLNAYPLFQPGTPGHDANQLPEIQRLVPGTQKFEAPTPVFRLFPASLTEQSEEDEELITLNEDFTALFEKTGAPASDFRRHYPMVGAVWIDEPNSQAPDGVFKADRTFDNMPEMTILAGEDALSNLAMESFTQRTRPNCFSCHNTLVKPLNAEFSLPPRRVNVSNVLTFFAERALESK